MCVKKVKKYIVLSMTAPIWDKLTSKWVVLVDYSKWNPKIDPVLTKLDKFTCANRSVEPPKKKRKYKKYYRLFT